MAKCRINLTGNSNDRPAKCIRVFWERVGLLVPLPLLLRGAKAAAERTATDLRLCLLPKGKPSRKVSALNDAIVVVVPMPFNGWRRSSESWPRARTESDRPTNAAGRPLVISRRVGKSKM